MNASGSARRNVELKARDPDPARSLEVCRSLGAVDHGVISQRDTYFHVPNGGLKLREETPGRPHLVQFQRANEPQERQSSYRIVPVEDGATLRAALRESLREYELVAELRGALGIVDELLCADGYADQLLPRRTSQGRRAPNADDALRDRVR